jgi:DNA-binding CsgD family transcriptional regulator
MARYGNHTTLFATGKTALLSKISEITRACDQSDSMMVSIYLVKKEYFIYCNRAFKEVIGGDCTKLLQGGWEYWFSLINIEESIQVKNKIFSFFSSPHIKGSFVLKYHVTNVSGEKRCIKHEILLYNLENQIIAVNYFSDITIKEKIEKCLKIAEKYKQNTSEELIKTISPREKEVLKLVADGYSSKQIADRLFISNHTAISHRKNLIEKFNVKNTAQLIKRASINAELW